MQQPSERTKDNLTGYKQQLASLTSAMYADVQRLGISGPNADGIRALADSVADDLGGGTGSVHHFDSSATGSADLRNHAVRVERLIRLYETVVRQATISPNH